MNHTYVRYVVIALALCMESGAFASEPTDFFESKIRPLLVQRCEKCHGVQKQKSGLRLDSRADLRKGGERGPVLVPGKPGASLLIKAVRYGDPDLRMPPGGKLAANEIADLEEWVRRGAPDPRDGSRARLGGVDVAEAKSWWSLQPVKRPVLPNRSTAKAGTPDAIDAFISTKLAAAGLTLSVAADRRSLIRRATYDLTGLAPTPAEVDAFVADRSSDAFARVVERLLASRYYGERWGRHWLDLVRYADTAGENSDHPLPHAWRYRNWVIDAFNRDQAYDEFVREQIAGDLLAGAGPPEKYAGRVVAGGFLALARRFGHDIDRDMHLTYEDVIDTLGKTVLGLSLGCARCHDHKYDPVSMKDYYALYGIFESTKFSFPGCEPQQQPRDLVPMMASAAWERRTRADREKLGALDEQLKRLGVEQAVISRRLKEASPGLSRLLARGAIGDGKAQDFAAAALGKTEVKRGEMIQLSVSPLASHGADTTLIEWEIAELAGKKRSWNLTEDVVDELTAGNPHADRMGHPAVWCFLDLRDGPQLLPESIRADSGKPGLDVWRNGETPSVFVNATRQPIRVWTTLPPRSFFAHPSEKGPVGVAWISPIDGVVRITGRIADAHPGGPDGVGWEICHFSTAMAGDMQALLSAAGRTQKVNKERAAIRARQDRAQVAYAVTEGRPADARIHLRGDPSKPGPFVPRRWLEVLGGQTVPANSGSGRLQLARWLTEPDNPLAARVMVNRIWQHHFGKGLVKTPNDFGRRGQAPTHPELLDWLAADFVQSGWSIKKMHRLIMLSAVYQQAGGTRPEGSERDPANELCWRFDRRRLSAEEIRDSLLQASGQLDRTPGGPHPFPPEKTWGFTQHNPFSAVYETPGRSVYLMVARNRRHPFLGLFDGADPNATTPERQVTTVPTQALYFMNDRFFHEQCEKCAERILRQPDEEARVNEAFRLAYQRVPTEDERSTARRFLHDYRAELNGSARASREQAAWSALARVLLAANEFLYLE